MKRFLTITLSITLITCFSMCIFIACSATDSVTDNTSNIPKENEILNTWNQNLKHKASIDISRWKIYEYLPNYGITIECEELVNTSFSNKEICYQIDKFIKKDNNKDCWSKVFDKRNGITIYKYYSYIGEVNIYVNDYRYRYEISFNKDIPELYDLTYDVFDENLIKSTVKTKDYERFSQDLEYIGNLINDLYFVVDSLNDYVNGVQ